MLSANPVKNVMAAKRILFIVLGCSGSASLGGEGVQAFSDTLSPAGSRLLIREDGQERMGAEKDGPWRRWAGQVFPCTAAAWSAWPLFAEQEVTHWEK